MSEEADMVLFFDKRSKRFRFKPPKNPAFRLFKMVAIWPDGTEKIIYIDEMNDELRKDGAA